MLRDPSEYVEASYEVDPSAACDSIEDHLRELLARRMKTVDARLVKLIAGVVNDLLTENRLAALVDVNRLTGKETLARLVGEIVDAPQPRLMACCVDFVFGLGVQIAKNETEIANDHSVTKATVSRYCVHLKHVYLAGIPAPGMKSAEAVESYRAGRTGKSSRPARTEWTFQNVIKDTFNRTS
jgi:hypothetical protein